MLQCSPVAEIRRNPSKVPVAFAFDALPRRPYGPFLAARSNSAADGWVPRTLERVSSVAPPHAGKNHAQVALGLLQQGARRIDLLLTDVVMPGMNGRELGRQAHN
jgi:hypothetical protein